VRSYAFHHLLLEGISLSSEVQCVRDPYEQKETQEIGIKKKNRRQQAYTENTRKLAYTDCEKSFSAVDFAVLKDVAVLI
jgi:hypothetical protein